MTAEFESLCDLWRGKLAAAKKHYELAKIEMGASASETMPRADGSFAFRRALNAETQALAEYTRVLTIFHRLTVHGEMPPTTLPSRPAVGGEEGKENAE